MNTARCLLNFIFLLTKNFFYFSRSFYFVIIHCFFGKSIHYLCLLSLDKWSYTPVSMFFCKIDIRHDFYFFKSNGFYYVSISYSCTTYSLFWRIACFMTAINDWIRRTIPRLFVVDFWTVWSLLNILWINYRNQFKNICGFQPIIRKPGKRTTKKYSLEIFI